MSRSDLLERARACQKIEDRVGQPSALLAGWQVYEGAAHGFFDPVFWGIQAAALERNRKLRSEAQRLMRKGMAYVHEHYPEGMTREALAQYVGVSEDYLTRCFRKELGLMPMAYLNRYRVSRAKELLAAGNPECRPAPGSRT